MESDSTPFQTLTDTPAETTTPPAPSTSAIETPSPVSFTPGPEEQAQTESETAQVVEKEAQEPGTLSAEIPWYNRPSVRWVIAAILGLLVVGLLLYLILSSPKPASNQSSATSSGHHANPSQQHGHLLPPKSSSIVTSYGALTGNLLTDTHIVLPVGSVVTIYSPYSKGYLRMVNDKEALETNETVSAGGAVIQADGKSGTDLQCQWIVKSPFRYKGAVRLDNAAYDALYLAESIPSQLQGQDNKVMILPGVGVEWSDFIVTTLNFVDPKFANQTSSVVFIGVEVAVLNDVSHIVSETHFLMGTTEKGTMANSLATVAGPSSSWQIKIVGSVGHDGNITHK